ncbi:MAG: sigma-70 family RNA polymerase sigma factor [Nanoarchaeota archaeon]
MIPLEDLEKQAVRIARRYSSSFADIEDLAQIGRIAAWQASEKEEDYPLGYYKKVISNAIGCEIRRQRAQKRTPLGGFVSLDSPLSEEEDGTLHDVVGHEDSSFLEVDGKRFLHDILRKKFGHRNYLHGRRGILNQPNGRTLARRIVRAAISEVAKIPLEEIPSRVGKIFFEDMGLTGFLRAIYHNSPFEAVQDAYSDNFLPWDFNQVPKKYWQGSEGIKHGADALKWFCAKHNLLKPEDCKRVSRATFKEDGLRGLLQTQFQDSPTLAFQFLFPGIKPEECSSINPSGHWNSLENRRLALVSYLFAHNRPNIEILNPEETYDQGLKHFVTASSLSSSFPGLLYKYNGNVFNLFHSNYPAQILPWTLTCTWKNEPEKTVAEAVRWLFDKYLGIPLEEIPHHASKGLFKQVGFYGYYSNKRLFGNSTYRFIDNAYPGSFTQSDFYQFRKITRIQVRTINKNK